MALALPVEMSDGECDAVAVELCVDEGEGVLVAEPRMLSDARGLRVDDSDERALCVARADVLEDAL